MPSKLTQAQCDCLRAIQEAGTVVMQSHGRVLGAGNFLRFMPVTFMRLLGLGYVEFVEPGRMRLTSKGTESAKKGRPPIYDDEDDTDA